ncbi:MAG: hypothetical protein ABSA17_01305 [Rhabdochlamydiaceae bacterium]|jgi:hypothetical protein
MPSHLRKSLLLKIIAEESDKTKKARLKLKQKLDRSDKKLTEKALQDKSQEIAGWIERHASDRISVEKEISLFDQNRNSAKMSRSIEKLAEELAKDLKIEKK